MTKQKTLYHRSGTVALITNVARWCRENDLSTTAIYEVMRGVRRSYKGWAREVYTGQPVWSATAPDGVIHQFTSIRDFALEHQLDPSNLRKVLLGWAKSHKGWTRVAQNVFTIAVADGAPPKEATEPPTPLETPAP